MGNINHQYSRSLRFKICFPYLQIIFLNSKTFYAMINLGIADTFCEINLFQHITKLKGPMVRTYFVTLAGFISIMVTLLAFFQFTKYFFEAAFTNALFTFGRNYYCSCLVIISYITISFQVFNKVSHAIFIISKLVLFVEFIHPLQCFTYIAACVSK